MCHTLLTTMSGVSTTSTTTLKTVTSKVLPGDKTGLPLEVWQIIFSYLSVRDLCCVARVSKTWYDLSLSVDLTRWKELYLACQEWRHPYWPLNNHLEPSSWKVAYRNQFLSTRFWHRCSRQALKAGCMTLLKRTKERHTIEVGPGLQHESLRSAFAVAGEYDRILVHPGIYDEHFEMSLKTPFELVGVGELGSVILVLCLEHLAMSSRFSNLVLRAPWFTNFILKVRSGYLQMDNCIMEDGMMCVTNPATCHIQFCTFRHSTIILQHVNASIIRNCEFSQSDNANMVVEGYPKEEKCWSYSYLCQQMDVVFSQKQTPAHPHFLKLTDSTTSTLRSTFTGKSFTASTIPASDAVSRGRAGSQDTEFDGLKVGVCSTNVTYHNGMSYSVEGAGVNSEKVNSRVSETNSQQVLDIGVKSAQGEIGVNGTHDSSSKRGFLMELHGMNGAVSLGGGAQHQGCLDTTQHQCLAQAEGVSEERNSHACPQVDEAQENGEWLEILDERKAWQLVGEEKMNQVLHHSDLPHKDLPKERSDLSDIATAKPHSSGVASSQGAEVLHGVANYTGAYKPIKEHHNHCVLDTAGSRTDEQSPQMSNQTHLCEDSHKQFKESCPSQGIPVTSAEAAPTSSSGSNYSSVGEGMSQSVYLHQREGHVGVSGFPQNQPFVNSDPSRYHYHDPPLLQNPHPHQQPQPSQPQGREDVPAPGVEPHLPHRQVGADGVDEGRRSQGSFHSSRNGESSSDEDDLSILHDLESGGSSSGGSEHGHNNSTSSSDEDSEVEEFFHNNSECDNSDAEESVIMLPHLRQKHLDASLSANAVSADVGSICSQTPPPVALSISQEGVLSYVHNVRGCLIHQCRMMHSKGGVMVSLQGHALISACDISNVSYGIRCIQNARVVIVKNRIHHCRTSGIFMRLAASGLIAGNDIHSNNEAGLDIRKNADPVVQYNRIHHGKRSGVVVLGSGRGHIRSNNIYSNTEAGIYILYGGNPTVSENHIYDGKAAGVAINEGGQGFIFDNNISSNQWGGVDIRRGSCPLVCRNMITNGLGDGIVIGDQGQGTIENNIIADNAGCGLWLMSASRPYIHGNQISNNGDTGVMMVSKTDIQHEGNHLLPSSSESVDRISRSFSMMGGLLDDTPAPAPKCDHTTLQHNNIYHNAGKGVAVELGDKVDILCNAIYANHQDGVWVHQDALVTVLSNSISSNYGHGVSTVVASSVETKGNGIYDNHEWGVHCGGNMVLAENDIVGNQGGGVAVDSGTSSKITENRIQATAGPVVKIAAKANETVVERNKLFYWDNRGLVDLSHRAVVCDNAVVQLLTNRDRVAASSRHKNIKDVPLNKSHFLRDPPPRPAVRPPPPPTALPAHNVSAVTKVMVPAGDSCQQGSKLCRIL